jgi:hypothetical protein
MWMVFLTHNAGYASGLVHSFYSLRVFVPHDMLNVQVAGE